MGNDDDVTVHFIYSAAQTEKKTLKNRAPRRSAAAVPASLQSSYVDAEAKSRGAVSVPGDLV